MLYHFLEDSDVYARKLPPSIYKSNAGWLEIRDEDIAVPSNSKDILLYGKWMRRLEGECHCVWRNLSCRACCKA